MIYYVMRYNRKVIDRSTVSPLYPLDYNVNETKVRLNYLDDTITGRIGDLQKCHK